MKTLNCNTRKLLLCTFLRKHPSKSSEALFIEGRRPSCAAVNLAIQTRPIVILANSLRIRRYTVAKFLSRVRRYIVCHWATTSLPREIHRMSIFSVLSKTLHHRIRNSLNGIKIDVFFACSFVVEIFQIWKHSPLLSNTRFSKRLDVLF